MCLGREMVLVSTTVTKHTFSPRIEGNVVMHAYCTIKKNAFITTIAFCR